MISRARRSQVIAIVALQVALTQMTHDQGYGAVILDCHVPIGNILGSLVVDKFD